MDVNQSMDIDQNIDYVINVRRIAVLKALKNLGGSATLEEVAEEAKTLEGLPSLNPATVYFAAVVDETVEVPEDADSSFEIDGSMELKIANPSAVEAQLYWWKQANQ